MLAELDALDEAGDSLLGNNSASLYSYLVSRGVHQSVLSLADTVYAKTWSVDLHDLDAYEPGMLTQGGQGGRPGPLA
jgi:hypothetical protein